MRKSESSTVSPSFKEWIKDFRYWHISFFDIYEILNKEKKRILLIFLLFYGAYFIYGLKRPISYTAKGVFKNAHATEEGNLAKTLDFMWGRDSASSDENPFELFDTYGVLSKVVKNLHLQGGIFQKNRSFFKRLWDNLVLERRLGLLRTRERPPSYVTTKDILIPKNSLIFNKPLPINFDDLVYEQDFYTIYKVIFNDDENFSVNDQKGKKVGAGALDVPFYFFKEGIQDHFTLTKKDESRLKGKSFTLSFIPLESAALGLGKNISLKKDKKKLSFINISYTSHDKELSSSVVNQLMEAYQLFVMEKAREKISKQLGYLTQRKKRRLVNLKWSWRSTKTTLRQTLVKGDF